MRSMDFVFDGTSAGRNIKSLTVIDDATHAAVLIVPERALAVNQLECILEQLASTRGNYSNLRNHFSGVMIAFFGH